MTAKFELSLELLNMASSACGSLDRSRSEWASGNVVISAVFLAGDGDLLSIPWCQNVRFLAFHAVLYTFSTFSSTMLLNNLGVGSRDTLRLSRRREEVAGRNDGSYARFSRTPQKRCLLIDLIST